MKDFVFVKPKTVNELLNLLEKEEREYALLAGGTDLLVKLKEDIVNPEVVYDISSLKELNYLEEDDKKIEIGANKVMGELLESEIIKEKLPLLWQALSQVGSLQIRNRATLGGNCGNASPAGDSIPALMAYNATVVLKSPKQTRQLPLSEFFLAPGKTILKKGEIIEGFQIYSPASEEKVFFEKVGSRHAVTISKLSFALRIRLNSEKKIELFKIAFGSVGPTAIVGEKLEKLATGKILTKGLIAELKAELKNTVSPIDDYRSTASYRISVLQNLLENRLESLL
jgi:xanthine dehydrogenase FAD-binding subunit